MLRATAATSSSAAIRSTGAERILAPRRSCHARPSRIASRVLGLGAPTHRRLDRAVETLSYRRRAAALGVLVPDLRAPADLELAARRRPATIRLRAALVDPLRALARALRGARPGASDARRRPPYLPARQHAAALGQGPDGASLEGRMPLLDYRIVERATADPGRAEVVDPGAEGAPATGDADLCSGRIASAPKRGFTVPARPDFLLSDEEQPLQKLILSERARLDRGIFDVEELKRVVRGTQGSDSSLRCSRWGRSSSFYGTMSIRLPQNRRVHCRPR